MHFFLFKCENNYEKKYQVIHSKLSVTNQKKNCARPHSHPFSTAAAVTMCFLHSTLSSYLIIVIAITREKRKINLEKFNNKWTKKISERKEKQTNKQNK